MTPQQPEFIKLSESVEEIRAALLGDAMNGRRGIIHYHDQMAEDLYGVDSHGKPIEGKHNTVLLRLSEVEDKQKKAIWIFSGIAVAIVSAKAGISAFLERIFSK